MDEVDLRRRFSTINVWKRGSQRAPHKPLLLLYALGRCARGEPRQIAYSDIDSPLRELLVEFGPPRKSYHTEYPFWRLQNDGLWELQNAEYVQPRASNKDAKKSELVKYGVTGGLAVDAFNLLSSDNQLLMTIASEILDSHFPVSVHEDILDAVGLELDYSVKQTKKRDPDFRARILKAYEYSCAVCGFDVRLSNREVGIEAAHIKWHQAGGPDIEQNGLALCVVHHKMFDRGAIGLSLDRKVSVSEHAHGTHGFSQWLLAFHGRPLRDPVNNAYRPQNTFINWHLREVFRSPPRSS